LDHSSLKGPFAELINDKAVQVALGEKLPSALASWATAKMDVQEKKYVQTAVEN
jgi:hypothetical protein